MFDQYYRILGLKPGASGEDIKNAYRLLAKKFHPDVCELDNAHDLFIEISEAYEILVNRKVIDDLRASSDDTAEQRYTYEYFTKQAREKAKRASQMRYENLKKEHEAFQKSGMYDVMLLLEYLFNYFLLLLSVFMMLFPLYLTVSVGFHVLYFLWIPGIFLILYIKGKGRSFFVPGPFFYNIQDLRQLMQEESGSGTEPCQYTRKKFADAYPYKLSLLKVHDIHLQFKGVLQHRAFYKRSYRKLQIPRCKRAQQVHSLASIVKVMSILSALVLLPVDSLIWKLLAGMIVGGMLAMLIHLIMGVRSKVSYLLNRVVLAKILVWIVLTVLFTDFTGFPNLITHEYFLVIVLFMLFFQDMVIDPIVKLVARKGRHLLPLLPQPEMLSSLYRKGYQPYLEIPVWATIFPLIKWLF